MVRVRLSVLAAAFLALAAAGLAPPRPLPVAAPCVTDFDCEARFGAGAWFPGR